MLDFPRIRQDFFFLFLFFFASEGEVSPVIYKSILQTKFSLFDSSRRISAIALSVNGPEYLPFRKEMQS